MKLAIKPWVDRRGYPQFARTLDADGATIPKTEEDKKKRDASENFAIKTHKGDTRDLIRHLTDNLLKGLAKPDDPVHSASTYGVLISSNGKAKTLEFEESDVEWMKRLLDRPLGAKLLSELGYEEDAEITYGLHLYWLDLQVIRGHFEEAKKEK